MRHILLLNIAIYILNSIVFFVVSILTKHIYFQFLELLPSTMEYIAMLTITMDMNDVISEEAVEDAISTGIPLLT